MSATVLYMSMSLHGFIAGPNEGPGNGLGDGGHRLAAYALGQRVLGPQRGRFVAFLAGLAILRVLAIVPVLGGIVWFAATVLGLGLLVLAAGRARDVSPRQAEPAPAPA